MKKIKLKEIPVNGMPLYEMQQLFHITSKSDEMKLSYITLLPGKRVPLAGVGSHEEDEYSFFIEGEVYTESGDFKGICKKGDATLIPRGEMHWCENRTEEPCRIICLLCR
ncbi:MAG: cupin domain-containing protein [Eubacteriaceae bacterium]